MPSEGQSSFEGTAFRHVSPGHEGLDAAALEGSERAGGRFNPAGAFGAIYLSLDEDTAIAELRRRAARTGIAAEELLPRLLLVVRAELQKILDLTNAEVRSRWGLTADDLGSDDYRPCQEVAEAARRAGYEAILFPSAADEEGHETWPSSAIVCVQAAIWKSRRRLRYAWRTNGNRDRPFAWPRGHLTDTDVFNELRTLDPRGFRGEVR